MNFDPASFKAPYISREEAWKKADETRKLHWPSGRLPVDVEKMLWRLGVRVQPVPFLKESHDIEAFLRNDLTAIIVDRDEYMDDRMQNRIRFSIAHELGHFILHRNLYRELGVASPEEWLDVLQQIPEDQYGWIEAHAYEFAGRLLVPIDRLRKEFSNAVEKARRAGFIDWDESGDAARAYMANSICRIFGVSSEVIEKRIIREKLSPA